MMYSSNAESYRQFLIDRTKQYQSIVGASPTDGQVKQASAVDFIKNNKRVQMMEKADRIGAERFRYSTGEYREGSEYLNNLATKKNRASMNNAFEYFQKGKNRNLKDALTDRASMRNSIGDNNAFGSHSGPELQIYSAEKNPFKITPYLDSSENGTIIAHDFKPKKASFDILGNYN